MVGEHIDSTLFMRLTLRMERGNFVDDLCKEYFVVYPNSISKFYSKLSVKLKYESWNAMDIF